MGSAGDGIETKAITPTEMVRLAKGILGCSSITEVARWAFHLCRSMIGATRGYVAILDPAYGAHGVVVVSFDGEASQTEIGRLLPNHRLARAAIEQKRAIVHNDFPNSEWAELIPSRCSRVRWPRRTSIE